MVKNLKNFVIPAVIAITTTLIVNAFNLSSPLNYKLTDSLYPRQNLTSSNIIIIGVDDASLKPLPEGLGKYSSWDGDKFAVVAQRVLDEAPHSLTIDFYFSPDIFSPIPINKIIDIKQEVSTLDDNDKLKVLEEFISEYSRIDSNPRNKKLAQTLGSSSNTIAAAIGEGSLESLKIAPPSYDIAINTILSLVNAIPDSDGTLRKSIPYFYDQISQNYLDNMAVATVRVVLGLPPAEGANFKETPRKLDQETALQMADSTLNLPVDQNGFFYVNFFGPPNSFQQISFVDVYRGNFPLGTFTDKIVLIGPTSSKQFHDEYIVPTSKNSLMTGIEFRAHEIQTILEKKFLLPQSKLSQILTIIALSLLISLILSFTNIIIGSIIVFAALPLYYLAARIAFQNGIILNMVYPFIAIILTYLTTVSYKYFVTDRNKRHIQGAFGRYVNKSLVDQISQNPEQIKLGGQNREVTIFFSDIKNSTTYSEQIAIEAWVSQINEYFTAMENIIMQSGGTLDKYEGDAIMAFWNAPINQEDHQIRAYKAALTMKESLRNLHQKWQKEGKPLIEFRIGINTGMAIVGNFGSENRLDYTAMGDTVNTASRLESAANKTYGTTICIAGLKPEQIPKLPVRELDTVLLPGKKEPITLYELYEDHQAQIAATYGQALALYKQKNFQNALQIFQTLKEDPPAKLMAARCQALIQNQTIPNLNLDSMVYTIEHK